MGVYEFRESLVSFLQAVEALECRCEAGRRVAGLATAILRDVAASGLRVTRWRNPEREPWPGVVHVAGVVMHCREYRRSCPGFIVDQRQACSRCGHELVRGKFSPWFRPGAQVVTHPYGSPLPFETWRTVGGDIWEECRRVT